MLAQGRLTLQVVCFGLAHFRLPVRPRKSPSRPTRENPGRPRGGGLGGGSCQTATERRVVAITAWTKFTKSLRVRSRFRVSAAGARADWTVRVYSSRKA